MKRIRQLIVLLMIALVVAVSAVGCTRAFLDETEGTIKVGSKDFIEQLILGQMYAALLESKGFRVQRKLKLGGTPVVQANIKSGEIDLYPEYTGTALVTVLKQPYNGDKKQVLDTVSQWYRRELNLVWLDPAPMDNSYALAMTARRASQLGIETLSDLVTKAGELVAIGPPDFPLREDGLLGLKKVYGDFKFKQYKAINPGLRYRGIAEGQGDVVVGYGTDGEIRTLKLVVLADDRHFFPPYQVTPVVRREVLEKNSEIRDILNAIAPKLTNETMQRLNYEVSGKHREPIEVAKAFLMQEGLIDVRPESNDF